MKVPVVSLLCLVMLAFSATTQASAGPVSPLYLANSDLGNYDKIVVIQGGSVINSFSQAYGPSHEMPIAVSGDVRTTGNDQSTKGGQYSLAGKPTGVTYSLPTGVPGIARAVDSTTNGSYNYLIDATLGTVVQTNLDYTNQVLLFSLTTADVYLGITYDPQNHSLWVSAHNTSMLVNYSMSGAVLNSFDVGHMGNDSLAFDPADGTLWLVNNTSGYLEQYSTAGKPLSLGPHVGVSYGAEFDLGGVGLSPSPEPGTLIMFGSGILGLLGFARRKINL